MPIDPHAAIEITAFDWVPPFAQGFVRDLRVRWALEEIGLPTIASGCSADQATAERILPRPAVQPGAGATSEGELSCSNPARS